ncbi:MAG: TetR family transcriptional regulator [Actinomycetota bacterium]|nr:TetR family transcriptional regulator [Actinomycetota bacterium]
MKTPPDELAAKLIGASGRILSLDGEVKLDEVATSIGVARATLYYYFSGRDDLVGFLLAHHLRAGGEVLAAALADGVDLDPADRLRAVVESLAAFLAAHPGVCAGLLGAMGAGGRMAEVMAANDRAIGAPLRELLVEGRALGAFSFDDTADAANALMGAMVIAVLARAAAARPLDDPAFPRSLADQLTRSVAVSERS